MDMFDGYSIRYLLSSITPYIYTIVYMVVLVFIIRKIRRRAGIVSDSKNAVKKTYNRPPVKTAPTSEIVSDKGISEARVRTGGQVKASLSGKGMSLADDRSSDWLAMQLKEEERAMVRISDMFQLKRQHSANCDAEFIKRFHESNCDAHGVDDGVRK